MNKFERHNDPYKALGVGTINNPLTIIHAEYLISNLVNPPDVVRLDHHQQSQLFSAMERSKSFKELKDQGYFYHPILFRTIDEKKGIVSTSVSIKDIMGKCVRVEFENNIYKIPKYE